MLLLKSMKDVINILGGDKQKVQSEHKEFYDFVKTLPNSNWQVWAAKQYKNNPDGFKQYKDDLIHFSGSIHIKDIVDHRFDNKIHDTWEKGVEALKQKENQHIEKLKQNQFIIKPSSKVTEIVPIDEEWGWFDLGAPYCTEEGKAMGHCGNTFSHKEGDKILSLRRKVKIGNDIYHEPHLTFVEHNGYLGEMKGRGNEKPSKKYHTHIVKLLESNHIKGVVGGGYAHHNNFSINDLASELKQQLLQKKPDLDVWNVQNKVKLPEKFKEEQDAINWVNNFKKTHGDRWKNVFVNNLHDHNFTLKIPAMFLNTIDYHGTDKDLLKDIITNSHLLPSAIAIHAGSLANDEELKNLVWASENDTVKKGLLSGLHADSKDIFKALNDEKDDVRLAAVQSVHFGPEHMEQALNDKSQDVRLAAVKSKHFGPEHMDRTLNDKDWDVRLAAIKSKHFGPEHMERALNDMYTEARLAAVQSRHFRPEHMEQALKDKSWTVRLAAIESPHFGPQHMDRALSDKDQDVRLAAVKSKHFGPEHMERALNDESWSIRIAAVKSPHFGPEHMNMALNSKDESVRLAAVKSPSFGSEHMSRALSDKDEAVRIAAIKSPHFGPEHMEHALNNEYWEIRRIAVQSPHFGPKHMDRALSDEDWRVRLAAVKSKHFGPEHIERALNDENYEVRLAAVKSPYFGPEHMSKVLSDKDEFVRLAAVASPHFGPDHAEQGLKDSNRSVRNAVVKRIKSEPEKFKKIIEKYPDLFKSEFTDSEVLFKSIKDVINILGGDKQKVQSEHKEFYDFVKTLPNSNWQVWAAKQYKNNPDGFKQYKDDLIHFSGSIHIKDIADHRFDNKIHDTWEKGINALKEKENQYVKKIRQNQYLIKPSKHVKEIVSIDDNWGWFDLGAPYCTEEGQAMGHCGNRPNHVEGDRILSLRKKIRIGNEVYHEPHLTFVEHKGYLGEMKGRGNQKPSSKYHPYIVKLLEHKRIKGVVGGGYAPHQNFSINDLSSQHRERLLAKKPSIDVWKSGQDHVLPDKFKTERAVMQWMRDYKHKYRDNWKRQFLEDIKKGAFKKAPSTLLNVMDYHGQDKDVLRHLLTHADNIDAKLALYAGSLARDKELKDIVWSSANPHLQAGLLSGIYVDAQDVDKGLEASDNFVVKHAVKSNAFDGRHMDKALGHDFSDVRVEAVKSKHFGPEHMKRALNDANWRIRLAAVQSKHFGPEHMERALSDEDAHVRLAAVQSKHFGPEHMKKALNDENAHVRLAAVQSKHFGPEHMKKALNDENAHVRLAAVRSPHFGPEHMKRALNDEDGEVRFAAVRSSHFGPEHMKRALNDEDWSVRLAAVQSKHFGSQHIDKALSDVNRDIRLTAVQSKHFGPEHIERALNDEDGEVRLAAVRSPHFGPQHIDKALSDANWRIRLAAVQSKHFGPEHMERALSDEEDDIRSAAVRSPHFGPEHMERALSDASWRVFLPAVRSPHFGPEHADFALQHPDKMVRGAAISVIKDNPERFKDIIAKYPNLFKK